MSVSDHELGRTLVEEAGVQLERLRQPSYVDDAPAAASIGETAVLLAYLPMTVGLVQGRRSCDHHDPAVE